MRKHRLSELVELMQPATVQLHGDDVTVGPDVVLDSRKATAGCVFMALAGERVDGHDYAVNAVEAGAVAILGTRMTKAHVPHLLVDDSVAALSALARGVVRQERARGMLSIGITGSSGKTSTKDLLTQILESAGPTVAPEGSQNNEIGVPLTACRVDQATQFLVSEMGARDIGHISWLTSLVGLDIAAVLNIGHAHLGEFGDIEVTARAKAEILHDLSSDGWAVLNADDPAVAQMRHHTQAQIAWFGQQLPPSGALQVTANNIRMGQAAQASFDLVAIRDGHQESAPVSLQVVGRPQVSNALAAAAMALAAGMELDAVASALNSATRRSQWRMELTERSDGVLILNDAYNANPDSMAAALRTAAELGQFQRTTYPDARVIGVLGDMLELGPVADQMHREIGQLAGDLGLHEVIAVGDYAEQIRLGAAQQGTDSTVASREEVSAMLRIQAGDVVLVKASRGVGLETVAQALVSDE